jgi:hypothetical protein
MHNETQPTNDREQCGAHRDVVERQKAIMGEIAGLRGIMDDRLGHVTARVDQIYLMLANGRNGGGNGSANTLTVTATGGNTAPPAAPAKADDTVPWPRLIALLGTIALLLAMLVVGTLTGALKITPEKPVPVEVPK